MTSPYKAEEKQLGALIQKLRGVNGASAYAVQLHANVSRKLYELGFIPSHGSRMVEIGPGYTLGTSLLFAAQGANVTALDVHPFAWDDREAWTTTLDLAALTMSGLYGLDKALSRLKYLPDCPAEKYEGEADIVWSVAALEHVSDPAAVAASIRRMLPVNGLTYHCIDVSDHGGGELRDEHGPILLNPVTGPQWADLFEAAGITVTRLEQTVKGMTGPVSMVELYGVVES